jgi:hypothetical protein
MSDTIHIQDYLKRKKLKEQDTKPALQVNHATGKITGPNGAQQEPTDNRLARIKRSLERINNLMADLKEMSNERKS